MSSQKRCIVFVGGGTPLQKVLEIVSIPENVEIKGIFTPMNENATIEKKCESLGVALFDVEFLRREQGMVALKKMAPDWLLNVNSTLILSPAILAVPERGALNFHPGRLPDYAGLHVHQWAIRNGETDFCVTMHWMDDGLDTGPIAYTMPVTIRSNDTGLSLFTRCLNAGVSLVEKAISDISQGVIVPKIKQTSEGYHLYKNSDAKNGAIDWNWKAEQICNFVRAAEYAPFKSPTYQPTCFVGGHQWVVNKCSVVDASAEPGIIVSISDEGVIVGAATGAVLVTKLSAQGSSYSGAAIVTVPGLLVGQKMENIDG